MWSIGQGDHWDVQRRASQSEPLRVLRVRRGSTPVERPVHRNVPRTPWGSCMVGSSNCLVQLPGGV